jgi:membrane protein DedA with SNARE-associated domain
LLKKFGLGKALKMSEKKIKKRASVAIAISYEDPNLASITATAAGIIHMPFRHFLFLSAIWIVLWNIFWAALIYFLGETALNLIGVNYIYFILVVWIAIILFRFFISKNKT